ncbi:peptidylprolyl isomerase [Guyparkeria halophila]|uniref:Peptidyl-prolyl cis-trans isomerase n=1 Tax=Guyparkeria halophila TaxID=47960 RepID=A0ABZ0YZ00_9GAMM|nr:peptidylprolyl isomerase [Guyparkeria halophila]WQH16594.1 peptidylprolyl isomerase [Guyparkeria halophila]
MSDADTSNLPTIGKDSEVTIHYEIRLPDDRVVDSSFDDEPLTVTLGSGAFEPRLEEALVGLPLGEYTRILLTPQYAFGQPDASNVHTMPRGRFPEDMNLEPQLVVEFDLPNGESVPGTVTALTEDAVTVDFNHPLAGQNIQLIVKVLAIDGTPAPADSPALQGDAP